jgi:hypothetical protein
MARYSKSARCFTCLLITLSFYIYTHIHTRTHTHTYSMHFALKPSVRPSSCAYEHNTRSIDYVLCVNILPIWQTKFNLLADVFRTRQRHIYRTKWKAWCPYMCVCVQAMCVCCWQIPMAYPNQCNRASHPPGFLFSCSVRVCLDFFYGPSYFLPGYYRLRAQRTCQRLFSFTLDCTEMPPFYLLSLASVSCLFILIDVLKRNTHAYIP